MADDPLTTPAAIAFRGPRIRTMDPAHPAAEVVVVRDGRIAAVGGRGLELDHPDAEVRELGDRLLVPGFIDAHCHLSIAALQPRWGDLSAARTVDDLHRLVAAQAAAEPDAEWIRLDGWNEVATGLEFDRHDLDAVTGDRPTLVVHATYHQGIVNSAGLDHLGVGRHTGDAWDHTVDEEMTVRDEHGVATGLLIERAFGRAHSISAAAYQDPDRWAEHIAARCRHLLSLGITAVHDAACTPPVEAVYRRMRAARELPLSVLMMPAADPFLTHDFGDRLDGAPTGEGDEWLRVGALKFFADGGVFPAFDVLFGGEPVTMGYRQPDLVARLPEAVRRGFRVGVHAIGNVGVADALAAFRDGARLRPDDDHRFRVEHAGMAGPALASEIAALGCVAVVQPGFVDHVGEDAADFQPDDVAWMPFAFLHEAGVPLAGSSDDPCGPVDPMVASRFGITRCTHTGRAFGPDQALPLEVWLAAYTSGSAFAGGQEAERGSLSPGKRADLVVLDDRPAAGSAGGPTDNPTVAETWVAGRCAHRRA